MTAGTWTSLTPIPLQTGDFIHAVSCASRLSADGHWYVTPAVGGSNTRQMWDYDTTADTWTQLSTWWTSLPTPPTDDVALILEYSAGYIYIYYELSTGVSYLARYDIAADTSEQLITTTSNVFGAIVAATDGDIYLWANSGTLANGGLFRCTPGDTSWTACATAPSNLTTPYGPSLANLKGTVMACDDGTIRCVSLREPGDNWIGFSYVYHIGTNTWDDVVPSSTDMGGESACASPGAAFLFGGKEFSFYHAECYYWESFTTFGSITDLPAGRAFAAAVATSANRAYLLGGDTSSASNTPDLLTYAVPPTHYSAGSAATVTVTAAGSGVGAEVASGAAAATVTVIAVGAGATAVHQAGAAAAAVTVTAAGAGQAAEQLAGASAAVVTITSTGAGTIEAGISGSVQDFPDWVPPHVIIATDNVIYTSPAAGDSLPFRPTFVGLGGWATIVATVLALAGDELAAHQVILEWTSGGTVIATQTVDVLAPTAAGGQVAGVQITTAARSDELRITCLAANGLSKVLLTLAATTRTVPEALTPATFPGAASYAAGPAAGTVPAGGTLDLYAGPYLAGSRLVIAPAAALTVTAARLDVTTTGYTAYDAQSWDVADTAGGPLYLPAPAGLTRWQLGNAAGTDTAVAYYVEGVAA